MSLVTRRSHVTSAACPSAARCSLPVVSRLVVPSPSQAATVSTSAGVSASPNPSRNLRSTSAARVAVADLEAPGQHVADQPERGSLTPDPGAALDEADLLAAQFEPHAQVVEQP